MSSRQPTRKQLRKEKRQQKKARKNEYFSRSKHPKPSLLEKPTQNGNVPKKTENKLEQKAKTPSQNKGSLDIFHQERKRDMEKIKSLRNSMAEQRRKQLLSANEAEDRNIKKLEKQLKLNKRKSKGLPKMFVESGLDYILDMCDPEQMKEIAAAEKKFMNMEDEFAEDLALITGKNKASSKGNKLKNIKKQRNRESSDDDSKNDAELSDDDNNLSENLSDGEEESYLGSHGKRKRSAKNTKKDSKKVRFDKSSMNDESNSEDDFTDFGEVDESVIGNGEESEIEDEEESEIEVEDGSEMEEEEASEIEDEEASEIEDEEGNELDDEEESEIENQEESEIENEESEAEEIEKIKRKNNKITANKLEKEGENTKKKNTFENEEMDFDDDNLIESEESETENYGIKPKIKGAAKVNPDGTWEDIYGRLHSKDGSLVNKSNQKYIPPAVRAKMNQNTTEDKEAQEKLNRLKKQIKGLLNRLAISNMHNIAKQIESLYMSNSRNDMNETLGNLINESIISEVLTPERLLMEHVLLIAVLHANVGTEVGAHFLQIHISKFDEILKNKPEVEDKTLDNIVIALAQMYNFKIFDSKLMHEILNELGKEFTEKNVDCILHVLRNVGFVLRKDDPLALKNFILESNKKAASVSSDTVNGSRLRFLLDVLTAIKNNNMMKIPNYDDSYSEHLKKIMKGFIRKGNYVTQLNISLEDLLKAEEKGKWWVVGSAWTGNSENREKSKTKEKKQKYSEKLLEVAKQMRMNTDTRRDIFCVIMTACGIENAYEKLMQLGLTKVQEREIIHVLLYCCVREDPYNPYYAHLAQKLCEADRTHMLTLKYSVWDKLKAIEKQSARCLFSLASLLTHLFLNGGLPISTLKVIEFRQMDGTIMRFLRQIFLSILLHDDTEACLSVFKNVAQSDKLKMFRESLRIFLQLFVRKNLKSDKIDEKQRELLKTRSKMIERLLVIKDTLNLYD